MSFCSRCHEKGMTLTWAHADLRKAHATATAENEKLRALLVEAQGIIDTAETPVDDHVWSDRRRAWCAALAETEGAT